MCRNRVSDLYLLWLAEAISKVQCFFLFPVTHCKPLRDEVHITDIEQIRWAFHSHFMCTHSFSSQGKPRTCHFQDSPVWAIEQLNCLPQVQRWRIKRHTPDFYLDHFFSYCVHLIVYCLNNLNFKENYYLNIIFPKL